MPRPSFWERPLAPYCVAGPTASGKSAHAAALAAEMGGEVVNVDAYQIYRGLPILTAQPTAAELSLAPHHLYGAWGPEELGGAGRYFRLAEAKIREIQARGARPILVGGNGMYFKCLTHGLNELPEAEPALRAEIEALEPAELAARLLALDPRAAEHVNLQNPRHCQRALEICVMTGKPASELKTAWDADYGPTPGVFLDPPREALYAKINARTRAMLQGGVLEEVAALDASGPVSATAAKALGLEEIRAHLRGELTLAEVEERLAQATRRYAKRQVSWFRNQAAFTEACPPPPPNPS
jgi:tRNA dimethylallyltransferase